MPSGHQQITIGASSLGVTDKIAIALVESMLKVVVQAADGGSSGAIEWSLLLAQNALTDRSAAHLQLLLARCGGSLRKVDLLGNKFSAGGLGRIAEAHAKLVQRPELLVDEAPLLPPPPQISGSQQQGSVKSVGTAVSSMTNSASSPQVPGGTVLDIAALRLRRDQLLQQEAAALQQLPGDEPARPHTSDSGKRSGTVPDIGGKPVGGTSKAGPPKPTILTPRPTAKQSASTTTRQLQQQSPHHRSHSSSGKRAGQGKVRGASPHVSTPKGGSTHKPNNAKSTSGKAAGNGTGTAPNDTLNVSSSDDDERSDRGEAGSRLQHHHQQQQYREGDKKQPSIEASKAAKRSSQPLTAQALESRNAQQHESKTLLSNSKRHDYAAADEDQDDALSTATTETVVPDAQDFLDITANMNPAIDSVLNLGGHAEKAPDDLFAILREGYSKPMKGNNFTALTVLLLSHNNLTSIPPGVLPPTLLRIDLSNNALTSISGLERCKMLAVVNMRKNVIRKISGLEATLCIAHLFLGRNLISYVDGLAHLLLLETLDLSWNNIQHHARLRPLSLNSSLRHLLLIGNPIVKPLGNRYRPVMRNLCPSLVALDNERLSYSRLAESRSMEWAIFAHAQELVAGGKSHAIHPQTTSSRPLSRSSDRKGGTTATAAGTTANLPTTTTGRMPYGQLHETDFSSLQLLTRGITPPTGYASSARAVASGTAMRQHQQQSHRQEKEAAKKQRPPVSRIELVSKLSAQSQSYLEQAVVERLAAMQREKDDLTAQPQQEPDTDTLVENSFTEHDELPTSGDWSGDDGGSAAALAKQQRRHSNQQLHEHNQHETAARHLDPFMSSGAQGARPLSIPRDVPHASQSLDRQQDRHLQGTRTASPQATATAAPRTTAAPSLAGDRGQPAPAAATRSQTLEPRGSLVLSNRGNSAQRSDPIGEAVILRNVTTTTKSSSRPNGEQHLRRSSSNSDRDAVPAYTRSLSGTRRSSSPSSPPVVPVIQQHQQQKEVFPLLSSNAKQKGRKIGSGSLLVSPQRGYSQEPPISGPAGLSPPQYGDETGGRGKRRAIDKFSPIRSTLDKTDVSADGVNDLVLTMDPGQALSPLPRASKATRSAPLMPPPPPAGPSSSRRGPSPESGEVSEWMTTLDGDATAIHASLRTLLLILHTQKQQQHTNVIVGPGGAKHDLQAERERCVTIVRSSGMLDDTEIPQSVVDAFRFSLEELNDQSTQDLAASGVGRSPPPLATTLTERSKRSAALELVRRVGATKTVMRYLVALIDARREDLLEQYVAKMRGVFS